MRRRNITLSVATVAALTALTAGSGVAAAAAPRAPAQPAGTYIVQAAGAAAASAAVVRAGGSVLFPLGIIGGVDARLSSAQASALALDTGVRLTPDAVVHAASVGGDGTGTAGQAQTGGDTSGTAVPAGGTTPDITVLPGGATPATADVPGGTAPATADQAGGNAGDGSHGQGGGGSARSTAQLRAIGAGTGDASPGGAGVGVALVDTGVADTPALTASRVVRGPDFSGEGDNVDHYGHGTFMAGLIAGNGRGGDNAVAGVAPAATLVSVKVAGADGTTTMGQVVEGIGWVVVNRDQFHIRVLSLAFGANVPVAPELNPLDAAAEAAWAAGITVVAAAGNEGPGQVTSPGDDPWVVTAGAATTTRPIAAAPWSGSSATKPDVFAPGVSVVSLRAPGSTIDIANPSARRGRLYFIGSGTSMATAMTAGAVALLYSDHPAATPDDMKGALIAGSREPLAGNAGMISIPRADAAHASPAWWQDHTIAFGGLGIGLGTMMPWTSASWTSASWTSASWTSASWTSASWTSASWTSASWTSASWTSASWTSASWTVHSWS